MICVDGIDKSFGRRPAVRGLSLRVPRGAIYGLLGHNGAGKSTTLGVLLGQVFPDRGTVSIGGHDVFTARGRALARVGAIFEAPCFYNYLSGRRNLQVFSRYSGRVSRTQLNAVIDRVGLTQRIDHKVGTYSHGMRQRLALAQALLPRPEVLLLDEPTDGLDPEGIADFRSTLLALHNELGLTILFSSHLLGEVEKICTRVAVMRRGRKVFDGDWRADAAGENRFTLVVDRRPEALELLARAGLITPPRRADGPLTLATGWGLADVNAKLVHAGFGVRTIAPRPRTLEHFYLDQRALAGDTPPPASGDAAC